MTLNMTTVVTNYGLYVVELKHNYCATATPHTIQWKQSSKSGRELTRGPGQLLPSDSDPPLQFSSSPPPTSWPKY